MTLKGLSFIVYQATRPRRDRLIGNMRHPALVWLAKYLGTEVLTLTNILRRTEALWGCGSAPEQKPGAKHSEPPFDIICRYLPHLIPRFTSKHLFSYRCFRSVNEWLPPQSDNMGVIRKKTVTRGTEGGHKYICDVCSGDITSTVCCAQFEIHRSTISSLFMKLILAISD